MNVHKKPWQAFPAYTNDCEKDGEYLSDAPL